MGILFLVALVLIWPTYGLSILAWLIFVFVRGQANQGKVQRRKEVAGEVNQLIRGQYAKFFSALDIPLWVDSEISEGEADQCGRHIVNYIGNNPGEHSVFMRGLQKWKTKGSSTLEPIIAAESEKNYKHKAEIHAVCYRSIVALQANNKNLRCFDKINLPELMADLSNIEMKMLFPA